MNVKALVALVVVLAVALGSWWVLQDQPESTKEANQRSTNSTEANLDADSPKPDAPTPDQEPIDSTPFEPRPQVERAATKAKQTPQDARLGGAVGRVLTDGGEPAVDAEVSLYAERRFTIAGSTNTSSLPVIHTRTDSMGRFNFKNLKPGYALRVRARPVEFTDAFAKAKLERAEVVDFGTLVVTQGAQIHGRVLAPPTAPLTQAKVTAKKSRRGEFVVGSSAAFDRNEEFEEGRFCTVAKDGSFHLQGLDAGTYSLVAELPQWPKQGLEKVVIEAKETLWNQDITLPQGIELSGVVQSSNGEPVESALIMLRGPKPTRGVSALGGAKEIARTRSDAKGQFSFQGVHQKAVSLRVEKDGFLTKVLDEFNPSGAGAELHVPLLPCGVVYGVVRTASNEAAEQLSVSLQEGLGFSAMVGDSRVLIGAEAARFLNQANEPGLFAITDIESNKIKLKVHAEGCAVFNSAAITVVQGERTRKDFTLVPEIVVHGSVSGPKGQPVAGASVKARRATDDPGGIQVGTRRILRRTIDMSDAPESTDSPEAMSAVSDEMGRFTLRGMPEGSFSITAEHKEHIASLPEALSLNRGTSVKDLQLSLRLGGGITGTAYDTDGKPLAGALVNCSSTGAELGFVTPQTTGTDGSFRFDRLKPGSWQLALAEVNQAAGVRSFVQLGSNSKSSPGTARVEVVGGEVATATLRKLQQASIYGIVKSAGLPLEGVTVKVKESDPQSFSENDGIKTDAEGRFLFAKVTPGDYQLIVRAPGSATPVRREITVAEGAAIEEVVDLPGGRLTGRILDAEGKPAVGVEIGLLQPGKKEQSTRRIVVMARSDSRGGTTETNVSTIGAGGEVKPVITNERGEYEVQFVEEGKWQIKTKASNWVSVKSPIVDSDGKTTTRVPDVSTTQGGSVVVSPVIPKGENALALIARLKLEGSEEGPRIQAGGVGKPLSFSGLEPGLWHLKLSDVSDQLVFEQDIEVPAGLSVPVSGLLEKVK